MQPTDKQNAPETPARLLLNITHGFQARMLLRSDIFDTLIDNGAELIVCSPNADEDYFRDEFDHPQVKLESMPIRSSRVESQLTSLRQYLLMNPSLGATLNYKREVLKKTRPNRYRFSRLANSVLGHIPVLRKGYMKAEAIAFPGREFDELLKKHEPELVVTGTPGFNPQDAHLLRSTKRLGIPSATVMLSWDNLTSKGYMNSIPDHLLVWSETMAEEAVKYHGYQRDRIHWTGAAQFDGYHRIRERFDIPEWRRQHGLAPDEFVMMYGTINPAICPHEVEILRSIVKMMREGHFKRPMHLWIRLHPQVVNGPFQSSLQPFLDLQSDTVTVEKPPVHSSSLNWDLPKSDSQHLAQLLAASDLVITTSSTLSIDAACAGTPIANVFFDGDVPVAKEESVDRFRSYTHYAKILATGGIAEADSIESFASVVHRYQDEAFADRERRDKIIEQQIGRLDGRAGFRTAATLLELTGRSIADTDPQRLNVNAVSST